MSHRIPPDERAPEVPIEGSTHLLHEPHAPRWRRLPEERPRQIIDAAFRLFSDQGLEGARLDEIARLAGVSKGTIYLYFPSKEELFRAVIEAKVITVIEAAEQDAERRSADPVSAAEELRRSMTRQWEHLRAPTYLAMYRLVHAELHHFPDLMRFYGNEVIERSLRLTATIISRGIARHEFVDADPLVTARAVSSMLLTHALWYERRTLFDSSMSDDADAVRDAVIDFALRSLRPASRPT
ncbi:MAG TPA: TetR/AcrR family transcriptional regulator [Gemmatimonadaceae bacterium]|nr:TetR/AcrR family transcriptional regulator [Gemmatimonadaceae bacterium]